MSDMHPDWALLLRLDHVSLFPVFHETSGTLTQFDYVLRSSTVDIYIPPSLWWYCLKAHLSSESSGERRHHAPYWSQVSGCVRFIQKLGDRYSI